MKSHSSHIQVTFQSERFVEDEWYHSVNPLNCRVGGVRRSPGCFLTSRFTASGIPQEKQHKRQSYPHLAAQQRPTTTMSRKNPHNRDEGSCPALKGRVKADPSPQHHSKVCSSLHPGIQTSPSPRVWSSFKGSLGRLRTNNSTIQGCTGLTSPYLLCTSCHRDTRRTVKMATLATQPVAKPCQRFVSRLHAPLMFMSASRTSQQGHVKQGEGHIQQGHVQGHVQASVLMADVQLLAIPRKCAEPPPPVTFPTLATGRSPRVNYVRVAGKTSHLRLQPTRLQNSRVKADADHKAGQDYNAAVGDEVGADVDFSGRTSPVHSSLGAARIPQAPPPSQANFHPHSEVRSVPETTITLTMEETVEGETISITRQLVVPEEHPVGQHAQNSPHARGLLSVPEKEPPGPHGQHSPRARGLLSVPGYVHVHEGRPGYSGSEASGYYQNLSTSQVKINPVVTGRI